MHIYIHIYYVHTYTHIYIQYQKTETLPSMRKLNASFQQVTNLGVGEMFQGTDTQKNAKLTG